MSEQKSAGMFSGKPSNGCVLIVDDEPDVRKVVRLSLEKAEYDVPEAEDGEKAIAVINQGENPLVLDVIISDIRMPKINGVEAGALQISTSFLREGIVDYLVKPVEGEKLRAAVAKAMEQREIHRL